MEDILKQEKKSTCSWAFFYKEKNAEHLQREEATSIFFSSGVLRFIRIMKLQVLYM